MAEKLYTVEQISAMIEMHPKTVQRYIREGRLKAQKIGKAWRVGGHDLSVFLEGTKDKVEDRKVPGLQKSQVKHQRHEKCLL
jgi:excisionase family DNA binding protein